MFSSKNSAKKLIFLHQTPRGLCNVYIIDVIKNILQVVVDSQGKLKQGAQGRK